jgi:rhomboid protease GluP
VKLFLERWTPDEVLRAAERAPSGQSESAPCEANFYIGEWHLLRGDPARAKPFLQNAATRCDRNMLEHRAAEVELKRTPFP